MGDSEADEVEGTPPSNMRCTGCEAVEGESYVVSKHVCFERFTIAPTEGPSSARHAMLPQHEQG